MNQSLTLVKGTSGTGKGCRVSQLMSFLVMKGYDFEEVRHDFLNHSGTKMRNNIFGYYFKQLNILFAGRWIKPQKATGLFSWYSLDSLHSDIGGKGTNSWMSDHNDKHVIGEGNPLMCGPGKRPIEIEKVSGFDNMFLSYYLFDQEDPESYLHRIMMRTGKHPRTMGAFTANKGFASEHRRSCEELSELTNGGKSLVNHHKYDAPIWQFGLDYLVFIGQYELAEEFEDWSQSNTTLRDKEMGNSQLLIDVKTKMRGSIHV
tara:strand:- start:4769 stop:5548 length:780 start_codon:yes stop_codon:yes gene_type:complete